MARHRKEPERGLQRTAQIDRGIARTQPAGQLSIATLEEIIMRAAQAIELKHPRLRAIVHAPGAHVSLQCLNRVHAKACHYRCCSHKRAGLSRIWVRQG